MLVLVLFPVDPLHSLRKSPLEGLCLLGDDLVLVLVLFPVDPLHSLRKSPLEGLCLLGGDLVLVFNLPLLQTA